MDSFASQFTDLCQGVTRESRLRLAPTPSGFLHLGNAFNFSLNWLAAHVCGDAIQPSATLMLRVDDLDNERKRQAYETDLFETLNWLSLSWNGPVIYQSDRLSHYHEVLERLRASDLLFACQKSRKDLEPFGGSYPPEFRQQNLSLDAPDVAWRIKTPPGFPLPDFVVRRRDGIPAYQVASFADDLQLGMTHIVRGADLADSTAAQRFLAEVLSEDKFLNIKFLHHPLIFDDTGEKLSKSAGSASLNAWREKGGGPEKVFQTVAAYLSLEGDSASSLLESLRQKLR
jgi:glutamyl-tRNA synthetase